MIENTTTLRRTKEQREQAARRKLAERALDEVPFAFKVMPFFYAEDLSFSGYVVGAIHDANEIFILAEAHDAMSGQLSGRGRLFRLADLASVAYRFFEDGEEHGLCLESALRRLNASNPR